MSWLNYLKNREHVDAVFTSPESVINCLYFMKLEYETSNNIKLIFLMKDTALIKPKKWLDKGIRDIELTFNLGVTKLSLSILNELMLAPLVKVLISTDKFMIQSDVDNKTVLFEADYFYLLLNAAPHTEPT